MRRIDGADLRCLPSFCKDNCRPLKSAKARRVLPHCVDYIRRRQMPVVLFHHARIDVTEIACNNRQRHPAHDSMRGQSVPKLVETDRRLDPGMLTGAVHPVSLMAAFPLAPEHRSANGSTGDELAENLLTVPRQNNMPLFSRLAFPNVQSAAVRIVVAARCGQQRLTECLHVPGNQSKLGRVLANLILHIADAKMAIMLLDHLGVDVAQVLRHHHQRHSAHD
jgi:hypothetical protein